MRVLELAGLAIPVPAGWEARGHRGSPADGANPGEGVAYPYVHVATFPLPGTRAAYGGGAVEAMGPRDCFVALLEFSPSSAGTALFAARGVPRRLGAASFSSATLQRTIPSQLGCQRFFSVRARAFCCYVVMGGLQALSTRLPDLNRMLRDTDIRPWPAR